MQGHSKEHNRINSATRNVCCGGKSGMQKIVAFSTAKARLIAMVQCVQQMLFVKKFIESLGLKVKLPMIVQCDNKGAVDMANGWNINGNTKHIDIRLNFLRELKKSKII